MRAGSGAITSWSAPGAAVTVPVTVSVARMSPVVAASVVTGTTVSLSTSSADCLLHALASDQRGETDESRGDVMAAAALQSPVRGPRARLADRLRLAAKRRRASRVACNAWR